MWAIASWKEKWSDGSPKYIREGKPEEDTDHWTILMDATGYTQEQKDNYRGWLPLGCEWIEYDATPLGRVPRRVGVFGP